MLSRGISASIAGHRSAFQALHGSPWGQSTKYQIWYNVLCFEIYARELDQAKVITMRAVEAHEQRFRNGGAVKFWSEENLIDWKFYIWGCFVPNGTFIISFSLLGSVAK